jgi:hypothetical protein
MMQLNTKKLTMFARFFLQDYQDNINLDNLSIKEIELLLERQTTRDETIEQNYLYKANTLMPSVQSNSEIQKQIYAMYLDQLRFYIEQRKFLEE